MRKELNSRQFALYNYLKEKGDEWTMQYEIVTDLRHYYGDCDWGYKGFHDSPARHLLTKDIQAINKSTLIQKIVLSSAKGIKLASESDFEMYIRSQYAALWRKKERIDRIAKKGGKDGQMRLVFNSERDTVKAFIDSDKAIGERLLNARHTKGLKAAEVVNLLQIKSVDAPMLSKFEKGYVLPNKTTLAKLAEIYDITTDYILTGKLSGKAETSENTRLQAVTGGGNNA